MGEYNDADFICILNDYSEIVGHYDLLYNPYICFSIENKREKAKQIISLVNNLEERLPKNIMRFLVRNPEKIREVCLDLLVNNDKIPKINLFDKNFPNT